MNRLTATLLSAPLILLLGSGCSMFRYDREGDPAPPSTVVPQPRASNETGNFHTFGGGLREVFIDYPTQLFDSLFGRKPTDAVTDMESDSPDRRRVGIVKLADSSFGKREPYTTRYEQIARFDANPLVRATALRSLNRARDSEATGVMIASLDDESPLVRLEAAKGLANMPNPSAAGPLLKVFTDSKEEPDVRIAAADALRYNRTLEVARALVDSLNAPNFGVSWQSRQSLRAMTGHDLHYNQSAWLDLLSGPQSPLG